MSWPGIQGTGKERTRGEDCGSTQETGGGRVVWDRPFPATSERSTVAPIHDALDW